MDLLRDKYEEVRLHPRPCRCKNCFGFPRALCVQVDLLKDKYEEVRGKLDCFQLLQEELGAGFTANQVCVRLLRCCHCLL